MKYVIEHLEPELFEWCIIEYKSISKIVGKKNLIFTNIKKQDKEKIEKYGEVFSESVKELIKKEKIKNFCILDPESEKELSQDDNIFDYFIFGGILGDYPPRKRTKEELTKFIEGASRNIGKEQFSTDNAVYVTNKILKGENFSNMKFQNEIEIKINKVESIILPYLYPIENNKPRISKELVSYIKNKKGF